MKVLVTGAAGFVGSMFVRTAMAGTDMSVVALVRNSDQRNLRRLDGVLNSEHETNGRFRLVYGDFSENCSGICEGVDAVVHFGAKTFVDRSIKDPYPFISSNVLGTYRLLEEARKDKVKRFIQISTDEVYGAILNGAYKEDARINPTNPYSATKAGADALVMSYTHTFGMWTAITRTENNYGPYQGPEKVFPTFVRKLLAGLKLPVYGDGKHRRQWLHVSDHVQAALLLLTAETEPGQIFHVAGSQELENLELAKLIIVAYGNWNGDWEEQIEFVPDHDVRPGHDRRYALECVKIKALGWKPQVPLSKGIADTVDWYKQNMWWLG